MNLPRLLQRTTLVVRFRVLAIGLALLTSVATIAIAVVLDLQSGRAQMAEHGRRLANVAARSAEILMADGRIEDAREFIKPFALDPDVVYIALFDRERRVLAESPAREGFPSRLAPPAWPAAHGVVSVVRDGPGVGYDFRDIVVPAMSTRVDDVMKRPVAGYVRIGISDRGVRERARDFLIVLATVAGAIVAVGTVLSFGVTRRIVQPLADLARASRSVVQGRAEPVPEPLAEDELRDLAVSFNRMTASLAETARELELHRSGLEAKIDARTRELKVAKEAAEAASKVKTQFLANMSHEIRTPVNGMLGVAQILARTALDERQQRMVGSLRSAGRSLTEVVDQVLDFSKLEAGGVRLAPSRCDLREVGSSVVQIFMRTAESSGVRLEMRLAADLPAAVTADGKLLRQVLVNLVGNALKFTPRGTVMLGIRRLGGSPAEAHLHFSVRDTGVGIPADRIEAIFEPFVQVDGGPTRRSGGAGLGLPIARRIVNRMGGDIQVKSSPGAGSTFSFTLRMPVAAAIDPTAASAGDDAWADPPPTADAAPAPTAEPVAPPPAADRPVPSRPSGSPTVQSPVPAAPSRFGRPRVLLVEDNHLNAMVVEDQLKVAGCEVVVARNGQEAVERCAAETFDLVLMDGHMPVMDGLAATRQIRRQEQSTGAHQPIVALTAHAFAEYRDACLRAGMDDFVAKPLTEEAFARLTARWLQGVATEGTAPA